MSRNTKPEVTPEVEELLGELAKSENEVGPDAYREAMTRLGEQFVRIYADRLIDIERLLLICTNEDADYLAQGVLNGLSLIGGLNTRIACFWNDREVITGVKSGEKIDIAPIVKKYIEEGETDVFLVVKSIISSACVVRTNITELVYNREPRRVLIYAPVVLKGAEERLKEEFDDKISNRFEFFWFAEDDQKEGDNVIPGIGGQVYERLGIGTRDKKNSFIPNLVKERRKANAQ